MLLHLIRLCYAHISFCISRRAGKVLFCLSFRGLCNFRFDPAGVSVVIRNLSGKGFHPKLLSQTFDDISLNSPALN